MLEVDLSDALNRSLALQLAPVLLGEAGKTISDNDRRLVAQALGYRVDGENILLNDGIGSFFQSEADATRKIQEIQRILRKNAEGLHGKYMQGADLLELTLETPEQSRARAGASYSVVLPLKVRNLIMRLKLEVTNGNHKNKNTRWECTAC